MVFFKILGKFRQRSTITLGARGDSYYEYLLKQWLQTSKTTSYLVKDFEDAMDGVTYLLYQYKLNIFAKLNYNYFFLGVQTFGETNRTKQFALHWRNPSIWQQ